MPNTIYIAETDASNAVSSVWVKQKGKIAAKVFNPKKHSFNPGEKAEFSGASEAEITRWLVARASASRG